MGKMATALKWYKTLLMQSLRMYQCCVCACGCVNKVVLDLIHRSRQSLQSNECTNPRAVCKCSHFLQFHPNIPEIRCHHLSYSFACGTKGEGGNHSRGCPMGNLYRQTAASRKIYFPMWFPNCQNHSGSCCRRTLVFDEGLFPFDTGRCCGQGSGY